MTKSQLLKAMAEKCLACHKAAGLYEQAESAGVYSVDGKLAEAKFIDALYGIYAAMAVMHRVGILMGPIQTRLINEIDDLVKQLEE